MKPFLTFPFILWTFLLCAQNEYPYSFFQPDSLPEWAFEMYQPNPDIEIVITGYNAEALSPEFKKNPHTRFYKRWIRQFSRGQNIDSFTDGQIEKLIANQRHYLKQWESQNFIQRSNQSANWTSIGPFDWDHSANGRGPTPGAAHMYVVKQSKSNPNVVYAGGATCGIWKSLDKGLSWQPATNQLLTEKVITLDIHPQNENIVLANIAGEVWKTINGGVSWNKIGGSFFYAFSSHAINEIRFDPVHPSKFYVGTNQALFRNVEGTDSLGFVLIGDTQEIEFHPLSSDTVYIVKRNAFKTEFYKSIDAGQIFSQITDGWPNPNSGEQMRTEIAVSANQPNKVYALAAGIVNGGDGLYGIYVSNDAGNSWTFECCGASPGGSASTTNKNILGGAQNGAANGGQFYYDLALDVSPTNSDSIFVGGINLWVSSDGGQDFTCPSNWDSPGAADYVHADIHDIHFDQSGQDLWIACDGGIFYSNNNGGTFERRMTGILGTDFYGFDAGFWDGEVMIGGTFHNATHLKDNDVYINGWMSTDPTGDGVRGFVNPGLDRIVYGDVDRKVLPGNRNAPFSTSDYDHKPNIGTFFGENSKLAFHPHSYNSWYVGDGNELWKTTDQGANFELLYTFNKAVADIEISDADPRYLYVTTFGSLFTDKKIYKSTDSGNNFIDITVPQPEQNGSFYVAFDVTLSATDPLKIWVARIAPLGNVFLNGFLIFESVDGGESWNNITTSDLDGELLTGIEHQKGTEETLYIGTRRSVYVKSDGQSNWDLFASGLPANTSSTKLDFYYKEGVIRNGTNRSVWESQLLTESNLVARPSADKLEIGCMNDSIQFIDHSIMLGEGATWQWTFPNGSPNTSNLRNPKVKFNNIGGQTIELTVSDINGTHSRVFPDFILVKDGCGGDTMPGLSIAMGGDPDYIKLPDFNTSVDSFTFSAWVKLNGIQNNNTAIVMNDGQNAGLVLRESNNTLGYFWPGGNNSWDSNLIVPSNKWAHVVIVVVPQSVTVYVNGKGATDVNNTNPAILTTLQLGRFKDIDSRSLNGEIDEVAFWSRALTQDEVRLGRHLVKDILNDPDMLAYYQFNEEGDVVFEKLNGYNGTLEGSANKVLSSVPIGSGVSNKKLVNSGGSKNFGETNVIIGFPNSGFFPGDEVVVTRLNRAPNEMPANKVPLTNGHWIINNYGTSSISLFNFITINEAGFFSEEMINASTTGHLYTRPENSHQNDWELELSENIFINNALNSAIIYDDPQSSTIPFSKLEQWLIVRDSFPLSESEVTIKNGLGTNTLQRGGESMLPALGGNHLGIRLPIVSDVTIEEIPSPQEGGILFSSDRNTIAYFNGTSWVDIGTFPESIIANPLPNISNGLIWTDSSENIPNNTILDMSYSKGYVLPTRLNEANILNISYPLEGMIIYNIDSSKLMFFDGARWTYFNEFDTGQSGNPLLPTNNILGISIGTNDKDPNAALEIQSDHQALKIPYAISENIGAPSEGLLIYDLSRKSFMIFDGVKWKRLL